MRAHSATWRLVCVALLAAATACLCQAPAHAAARARARRAPVVLSPTDPAKDAAIIIDGATGKTLYARNETALRHPASLTKMMTLYLLFEALKAGKITMQTPMPVSVHASRQQPTKLYLRPGSTVTVDTAIRAIVIRSANDVAVVIAEALGGTESNFAEMMTQKAKQFGMHDTNYHNASGLPDPLQITSAADLAILARHLAYDYPQYFHYFSLPGFTYNGVYYPTHDNLIGHYSGADGIKTGFTDASGFNLTSSVVRNGVHVIAVLLGGRTAVRRDKAMETLLDTTFAQINDNPALVARGPVPWQAVADATPAPAVAGFTLTPNAATPATQGAGNRFAALSPIPGPPSASSDEDAAEAYRAPDETVPVIHAEAPAPPPAAIAKPAPAPMLAPALAANIPAIRPLRRPDMPDDAKPVQVAALVPAPTVTRPPAAIPPATIPKARPVLRADVAETSDVPGLRWTVQIGAYADQALAKAQLNAYAQKSLDVLGKAAELVVPFQAVNGHTMYRARFGLYGERQAREVCDRLTQRGQTCFAAVASR